jgi:hypothetical protein
LATHLIEARSFRVALACCHNFWVLKNANGHTLAELHGLAYDRITRKILPIGTTKNHSLRVFVFAHDQSYAAMLGVPVSSTRMYGRSRAHVVYQGADALSRWNAALKAMPLLDGLDLAYPPFGFNVLTPTVNSNSAYRTFGEIMGVPVPKFGRVLGPGTRNRMLSPQQLELARFRPRPGDGLAA